MTENQPHQPHGNPPQFGPTPSYGSTPGEGTRPLPQYGQHQQQRGGMGGIPQYGTAGASQGTSRPAPPPWPGQPPAPPAGPAAGGSGGGSRRRGLALVAVTALLVGTAGGVGGAAAYSALDDPAAGDLPSVTAPLNGGGQAAPTAATDGSVQKAAQAVLPSVVKIGVQTQQGAGSGSGIVISADGLIVTNNHVVAGAANGGKITVTLNDNRTVPAQVVGRDELTDLAVIRADAKGLTPAKLGSSGSLQVGQPVVAIGSPFGLDATVTSGIVSALNRPVTSGDGNGDSTTVFPAVQTDAAINPGNSGGALIDLAGRVVGINSAIKTAGGNGQSSGGNIGLGFAIPIDQAKPIIDELARKGTATHARLGVRVTPAESADGLQSGAQVGEVTSGGAADKAGLKAGDIVAAIDGKAIASGDALVAAVRSHRPGDEVTITYIRGSETKTTKAKLASDGGNPTG